MGAAALLVALSVAGVARATCEGGIALQVLGSGGPEMAEGRAASGYLVWIDGRARVLIDAGGGVASNFHRSGARFADLHALLLTHLHVDHSADVPVLVKAAFFSDRRRDLPVLGPTAGWSMPSTTAFVGALFHEAHGAWAYLADFLPGRSDGAFALRAGDVPADGRRVWTRRLADGRVTVSAVPVHHGPVPALAWRVQAADRTLVVSGDTSGRYGTLAPLARGADLLVAHHAIAEGGRGVARELHMPPSVIGSIAAQAGVKRLVLSHRMRRTRAREPETLALIGEYYEGPVALAEDLDCFAP